MKTLITYPDYAVVVTYVPNPADKGHVWGLFLERDDAEEWAKTQREKYPSLTVSVYEEVRLAGEREFRFYGHRVGG